MEAAFVNTVHPGDVVVVAVNGLFGQRMTDVAARCGAEVVAVEHEWGQPVDVDRVLSAHPSPAIIAAVHAETSTGVRSDIDALGAGKGDALLLVDAVTSIAGIELRADDWGVDLGYAGTQKCLGVAPGPRPLHHQRPGLRAPGREAALVVPRPRHARWLRRRGGRQGPADLPPHRPDRDGRQPPRRPHPHPRRGPRRGLGPPPGRRRRAAGRARGHGSRAVRGRGAPPART